MRSLSKYFILPLFLFVFVSDIHAQTFVFAELKGAPVNTTGWNLQGAARIANITSTDFSELELCPAVNAQSGAIFYNQPINLSLCSKWTAEFDFRMYDGTGADGIAFCFLDVPPSGYVNGGGLGIPATANGLKVCFDTWNNCLPYPQYHDLVPKVELRWGPGYDECAQEPTKDNSDFSLSSLRSNNYNHAKVTYDAGSISVYINDQLYLTGFQQFNFAGYLGFTASTGGFNDNHSIKNVVIYTDMPPSFASVSDTLSACPGKQFQLGTTPNPDYVYKWSPSSGISNTDIANPLVTTANNTLQSLYTKYYVSTSFASKPGCASMDSVIVKAYPKPAVNFINPEICLNDAIAHFTDSSYTGDNTQYPFTYAWNFGDPNAGTANPNTSTIKDPDHKYKAQGNYNVLLKVATVNGCIDSTQKVFTVNGAVPKAAFTLQNTSALCSNSPVQLQNNASVDFGSITRIEIHWDENGNSTDSTIDETPVPGKIYTHLYSNFQQPASKSFLIKYIAYSGITCLDETTQTITVNASPQVIFTAMPGICYDTLPRQITQASTTGALPGTSVYTGTGVNANGLFDTHISGAGNFPVTYTFTADNGCKDSATQPVTITANPVVNAGPDLIILVGGRVTINATATGNALTYQWLPAININNQTLLQPTVNPILNTYYYFTATGAGNCSSSDTLLVKVLPDPVVPNAFSPNGDGINDKWVIRYLDLYPACTVSIFNRYGQPIFRSEGYANPWDGKLNGQPLPVATYYYIIDRKNIGKTITGSLTLLR